jgi:PAS domain S-box-containing protein
MTPLQRFKPYGIALLAVAAALLLRIFVLAPFLGDRGPFSPFTLAILFAAWTGGIGPGLLATAVSLGISLGFFIPPDTIFTPSQFTIIIVFIITNTLLCMVCESMRRARRRVELSSVELRASEERFRTLADDAPILIWLADAARARTWFNRAWLEFTGRTMEREIGNGWVDGVHPDDFRRCLKIYTASFEARQPFEMDYRLRRHDGEYRWIIDRGTPMFGSGGSFSGYMGGCVDIHERKEAEQNSEARLHAEQAARAEAERIALLKDEFLATVSHEMRTPLSAILGWSQLLRKGDLTEEAIPQAIETIERNARTQSKLIEDLLDMSHILSGRMRIDVQRVKLPDVIEAALAAAEPAAAAKSIRIVRVLDTRTNPVSGDPIRLQQVVWNLLNNAIKFTPSGGKVTVTLERVNSHLEISVADSGEGIPPEFLPHVFDRFRQANATSSRHHGGLGLGLAIVKQLVELHGGTVRAKSPGLGEGSTFTIHLPVSAVHGSHIRETFTPTDGGQHGHDSPVPSLSGADVLIVDDDRDTREMLRTVLEKSGAVVRTALSAEEGFTAFDERAPDVLISDIGMPGEDGYTLIRKIREHPTGSRIPAVALTAFARSEDRRRAITAGFQMHLAKPVEPAELVTVIASLAKR